MKTQDGWRFALFLAAISLGGRVTGGELQFRHHFIDRTLPATDKLVGDYGLTALVDLDRDGDLDFVLGGKPFSPSQLYWFEFQGPDRWARHLVGTNYLSDVGLAALDVDRDGWPDLVCSGVWYRNPGNPQEAPFERITFDGSASGAHDILVADIDGDGRPDVVMMGDERTRLNSLCWYAIPPDPRQPWERHPIGPPVHGAISPGGVADLDGDGDLDLLRADTWFENKDGKGREWVPHKNMPMGRRGPFGVCVRTAVADLDGDRKPEIIIADADIVDSKVAVLKNADGKGGAWVKTELPQSFTYGSLHSLGVADFNGDGRPDIVVNEQEELLPPGRENPRWIIWENLGGNRFAERIMLDAKLGGHELQVGDVDGDGDMDICSKPWGPRAWNGNGGRMHVDFLENLRRSGKSAARPTSAAPATTAADYFPPPESGGGWRSLTAPEEVRRLGGTDPEKLQELQTWLLHSDQRSFAAVVIHQGYVVLEVERGRSARTDAGRVASVSKAVCATVLAIASERSQRGGAFRRMTFDDPAFDFIPWAQPLSDPRKARITVKQLLNHTSGICPEATGAPNDGSWEYILGHSGDARTAKLAFAPGTACGYSSIAFAHAALVCETVTGRPYDQFAIEALFKPLGIEHWSFQYYQGGQGIGRHPSHGLGMPARDLARIAYCMLRDGRWGERQVIPEWFVKRTAKPSHSVATPEMRWKLNPKTFSLGWELPARLTGESGRSGEGIPADARSKPGSGGQLLAFVPSLDLVVTRQTGASGDWQFEEYLRRACAAVLPHTPGP